MGKITKTVGFFTCRMLKGMESPRGVPVLTFHAVENSGTYASTAVDHFRAAMKRLVELSIRGVSISELVSQMNAGQVPERVVALTFDDGLASFGEHAWPIMREYGHQGTLFVPVDYVGGVAAWYKDYGLPPMRSHTWDELRRLRDEGADIQSHGCRHSRLTTLASSSLQEELARSREILAHELNVAIKHFCYPFGDYNDAVIEQVRACGYASAVTMVPGCWRQDTDHLAIPRDCLDMINMHDADFAQRVIDACLDGSFSRYIKLRDRLKAMVGMSWEPPCGE